MAQIYRFFPTVPPPQFIYKKEAGTPKEYFVVGGGFHILVLLREHPRLAMALYLCNY